MAFQDDKPLISGMVGLGGYARSIRQLLTQSDAADLKALYSVDLDDYPELVAELKQAGVTICKSYDQLLAQPVEAIWLPVPIDLHAPLTIQALEAGKAVMCEKPAAGSVDDLDRMIAARDQAQLTAAISYQDIYDPATLPTKRRLLDGKIGRIHTTTLHACWPRTSTYYARSPWAGKWQRAGRWVCDSPLNNALAHYVNIAMFLLGDELYESAVPASVEAELYRANPIETFDTCSLRIRLADSSQFIVHLTHACQERIQPVVTFHGDRGRCVRTMNQVIFETDSGHEAIERAPEAGRNQIPGRLRDACRGRDNPDIALCTLEVARVPLVIVNGSAEAAPVHTLPDEAYRVIPSDEGESTQCVIPGIERAFVKASQQHCMLHETGLLAWTQPAGSRNLVDYRHFAGPLGVDARV